MFLGLLVGLLIAYALSFVVTLLVAIPIGIYSAVRPYSLIDHTLTLTVFIGMCMPSFLLALVLMHISQQVFGHTATGLLSPEWSAVPGWPWGKIADLLAHLWLPAVVLAVTGTGGMIRVLRANLLDEVGRPYVTTARAKGVPPVRLLVKYPLRLALNPFVSGIGGVFPQLVSGGAIISIVMSLPTIGPLMLDALMNEDAQLAGSLLMILSALGVLGTLVSDLLLLWLDPRIRSESGSR